MAVFTVHAPAGAANADATVFVREGFSWSAFSFGPLWLLWNRLWLAFGLWLFWIVALGAAATALKLGPNSVLIAHLLGQVFLGLEAGALLRDKLARRGLPLLDVVVGRAIEDVEARFFGKARRSSQPATASETAPPSLRKPNDDQAVLGLFPTMGERW